MALTIRYQEKAPTQARRLQVSRHFVVLRRRILAAKLRGLPLPGNTPAYLVAATPEALLRTLAVRRSRSSDAEFLFLIPVAVAPTDDLLDGRRAFLRSQPSHRRPSHPLTPSLPYGYLRDEEGYIHADPLSAPAIRLAFALMLELGAGDQPVPWQAVAERLNAAGFRTQYHGRPWAASDVRALTCIPAYAGYTRTHDSGIIVEPMPALTEPLIDLDVFLLAAQLKRRPAPPWLAALTRLGKSSP